MELLIVGIITGFDILIIKWKWKHKRYEDATLDAIIFTLIIMIFHGSLGGMVVGMIAALMISISFLINPPTLFTNALSQSGILDVKSKLDSMSKLTEDNDANEFDYEEFMQSYLHHKKNGTLNKW